MEKKRLTAVKTRIKAITTGKYVVREGFEPNYVLTAAGEQLSRVRVLATVVDKFVSETGKFASLTLDDGTETIRAKVFNAVSMFDSVAVGDIVDAIGRVREYQGEIYLMPEVVAKAETPNYELLRELELRQQERELQKKRALILEYQKQAADVDELKKHMFERFGIAHEEVEAVIQSEEVVEEKTADEKSKILELIANMDTGQGCDYTELTQASGLSEDVIDGIINELLSEGICFEPRPGKIKKL
ncbi:MAG: hypothetical protein HY368_02615 [Candidatus Aenigmarchaeota archaeon]|nr:hypothetical protein [Candidatus Aenigmarchaeota archaeon]